MPWSLFPWGPRTRRDLLCIFAALFIAYGYLGFNLTVIADEWLRACQDRIPVAIHLGRWGKALVWGLTFDHAFVPFLSLWVFLGALTVSGWVVARTWSEDSTVCVLVALSFGLSPYLGAHAIFISHQFPLAFGMGCIVAAYVLGVFGKGREPVVWAILLLALGAGVRQSLFLLYLTLVCGAGILGRGNALRGVAVAVPAFALWMAVTLGLWATTGIEAPRGGYSFAWVTSLAQVGEQLRRTGEALGRILWGTGELWPRPLSWVLLPSWGLLIIHSLRYRRPHWLVGFIGFPWLLVLVRHETNGLRVTGLLGIVALVPVLLEISSRYYSRRVFQGVCAAGIVVCMAQINVLALDSHLSMQRELAEERRIFARATAEGQDTLQELFLLGRHGQGRRLPWFPVNREWSTRLGVLTRFSHGWSCMAAFQRTEFPSVIYGDYLSNHGVLTSELRKEMEKVPPWPHADSLFHQGERTIVALPIRR